MSRVDRMAMKDVADKIIKVANTKKDADVFIKEFLVKVAEGAMKTERDDWLKAAECLGPKNKEKLMKERFGSENN